MSDEEFSETRNDESALLEFAETIHQSFAENPRGTIKSMKAVPTLIVETEDFIGLEEEATDGDTIHLYAHQSSEASGFSIRLKEPIGSGGMAKVDAASQNGLGREIALKRPREDQRNEFVFNSLIREAQLMAQLDHPNIPPVHQLAFTKDGSPIIMMKRVCGVSWATLIHEPWHAYWSNHTERHLRSHLEILRQVCHALEFAHHKGIIHRDLKTENVMVGDYGEVYLLDWGVAVELDEQGEFQADHFCGTPCFAAPEMFSATTPLTQCTDVYLLGAVLHELLTLHVLHKGKTFDDVIEQVRKSAPHEYHPDVHSTLAKIANKATEQRATNRFESVQEFREAIEHHLEYYQAVDLLKTTTEKLASLEDQVTQASRDGFSFHQSAFECRFGFRRVFEIAPDLEGSRTGLVRVLELQALYELDLGRVDAPRQLVHLIEKMAPQFEGLENIKKKLKSLETLQQKSGELSTQIQYKLLEELQKKQDS
jgi:serine/threonine-protein kinase